MNYDPLDRLTAQSTLGELPAFDVTVDVATRGQVLGEKLVADPRLPGVVVTESGRVRGAISRGQYQRLASRYLGLEVYHPRPISLMLEAIEAEEEPLVLAAATPIHAAVRRALERPRELVYEPVIVHGAGSAAGLGAPRLIDFQDLLLADSRISALRNQQMEQILSTVQEGFLLVAPDYRIAAEYSRSVERIFATPEIAGRRLPELLSGYLGSEKSELCAEYLETLFNPNVIEQLVVKINPLLQVVAVMPASGQLRHLAFRFLRSVQDGVIRRVLVRVEDVSREVALAEELAAQERKGEERVALALEIVRADPVQLVDFLDRYERELEAGRRLLAANGQGPEPRARVEALFRSLHGLKGEAGLLELRAHQTRLHRAEDFLAALRERAALAETELAALDPELRALADLATETRGLIAQFRRLGQTAKPRPSAPKPIEVLGGVSRLVEELAQRLGKPARFLSRTPEAEIPEKYRPLVRDALVQLARNAMVHGIEPAPRRRELGKPALATLQFVLRRHLDRGQLELVFQDDGAGLDYEKIRRVAAARGLGVIDGDALAQLIFESGFSTAGETTLDAGRGVGLDAVRTQVRALGGKIIPHSRPGAFCAFQILLPL